MTVAVMIMVMIMTIIASELPRGTAMSLHPRGTTNNHNKNDSCNDDNGWDPALPGCLSPFPTIVTPAAAAAARIPHIAPLVRLSHKVTNSNTGPPSSRYDRLHSFWTAVVPAVVNGMAPKVILTTPFTSILAWLIVPCVIIWRAIVPG